MVTSYVPERYLLKLLRDTIQQSNVLFLLLLLLYRIFFFILFEIFIVYLLIRFFFAVAVLSFCFSLTKEKVVIIRNHWAFKEFDVLTVRYIQITWEKRDASKKIYLTLNTPFACTNVSLVSFRCIESR